MKERPILFSAPMVRALLTDTKTQTRRLVKITLRTPGLAACLQPPVGDPRPRVAAELSPYGQLGDRLWVRETWGIGSRPDPWDGYDGIEYRADEAWLEEHDDLPCHKVKTPDGVCLGDYGAGWKPSIHMPRWASRITLEITGVRVERLQDISEADSIAEGASPIEIPAIGQDESQLLDLPLIEIDHPYRNGFAQLWESINGAGAWEANPWVWVVEFRRIEAC
jgi:hypothetical protein